MLGGFKGLPMNNLWRSPLCEHHQGVFQGEKMIGYAAVPAEHAITQSLDQLESLASTC